MLDTKPPFRLLDYTATPTHPGGYSQINANVRRELDRGCSVKFNRYLFDSRGFRFDLGTEQEMSGPAISRLAAITPDALRIAVPFPKGIATGPARFMTDLRYVCNPIHRWRPITVQMEMIVEVLP